MKTCLACQRTYDDDTMVYCLDDGARLVDQDTATRDDNATLNLPVSPTIAAAPRAPSPTAPNPATITARPEHFQTPPSYRLAETELRAHKSSWPWIFAIVLVLAVSGAVTAWLLTRGNDQPQSRTGEPTPNASPHSSPKASAEVVSTPRIHEPQPTFAVLDNTTLNGERITYYPRQTFAECEADCSGNASCRGFTWIRPGAYNQGDSAMCYLMSAVSDRVAHACCISGVRN